MIYFPRQSASASLKLDLPSALARGRPDFPRQNASASWKPKVDYPPIRFVRFSGRALKEGVKRHLIDGIEVPIFEPVKTVVDCFWYRNRIGLDIVLEGLREALRTKRVRHTS